MIPSSPSRLLRKNSNSNSNSNDCSGSGSSNNFRRRKKSSIEEARIAAKEAAEELYALSYFHRNHYYNHCHHHYHRRPHAYRNICSNKTNTNTNTNTNDATDGHGHRNSTSSILETPTDCNSVDNFVSRQNTVRHSNGMYKHTASHQDAMDRGSARGMSEGADGIHIHIRTIKQGKHKEDELENENANIYGTVLQEQYKYKYRPRDHTSTHDENSSRNIERENNQNVDRADVDSQPARSLSSKCKKKFRIKTKRTKKIKTKGKGKDFSSFYTNDPSILVSKSKQITKNAFMCAFCGSIFSDEVYASYHEGYCIKRGMMADNTSASTSTSDTTTMASITEDVVTNSIPNASGSSSNSQETEEMQMQMQTTMMIKMSDAMKNCILLSDEALIKTVRRAQNYSLTYDQFDAERELALMARDRSFYDMRHIRSLELQYQPQLSKKRRRGLGGVNQLWNNLQDRLSDAYAMVKEGGDPDNDRVDKYHQKRSDGTCSIKHGADTLYINIIVKHSARFIHNELDRLFQERWRMISATENEHKNNFEFLRHQAHIQALQLTKFALSPDVKPERVAIQFSNDLCRLISPQAKKCGVEIETDIDYRKGPFFILGVNVIAVDWILIMKYFHQEVQKRKCEWTESVRDIEEIKAEAAKTSWRFMLNDICRMTKLEIVEQLLALLNHISWIISVPLCAFLYQYFLKSTMQRLILTAVTDDFFKHAEGQGMEMDLQVKHSQQQTAFMLEALHQIRKQEHDLDKKKTEVTEGEETAVIRGPLLGPLIDLDDQDLDTVPENLEPPIALKFVVFESELPVGYRRLRRALLFNATFIEEALYLDKLNYTEIESGPWDRNEGEIGEVECAVDVDASNFIGAKKNTQYLMPRSVFVKANMAYEEAELIAYNEYFFSIKRRTTNPDVPYGRTFCAWTQITVHNTGRNSCRMECSVEAEFPNGAPIVARNITSAMRQGVTEVFLELGETVCKYASVL